MRLVSGNWNNEAHNRRDRHYQFFTSPPAAGRVIDPAKLPSLIGQNLGLTLETQGARPVNGYVSTVGTLSDGSKLVDVTLFDYDCSDINCLTGHVLDLECVDPACPITLEYQAIERDSPETVQLLSATHTHKVVRPHVRARQLSDEDLTNMVRGIGLHPELDFDGSPGDDARLLLLGYPADFPLIGITREL